MDTPETQPEELDEDGLLSDDDHIRQDCLLIERFPFGRGTRPAMVAKLKQIAFGTKVNNDGASKSVETRMPTIRLDRASFR